MTIEQTIEIPANGRVHLDLPPEMAGTSGKVVVTALVAPAEAKTAPHCLVSLLDLRGSCKGDDTMAASAEILRLHPKTAKLLGAFKDNPIPETL
ncbi:MAG: hypothetical protein LBT39_06970 [Treponema sp.]|jgi:hypothetical protein|nr:hypothetical protein [Treponema sp.]